MSRSDWTTYRMGNEWSKFYVIPTNNETNMAKLIVTCKWADSGKINIFYILQLHVGK